MNHVKLDFLFGDTSEHAVATWWELPDEIPNKPGIYAWFIRFNQNSPKESKDLLDCLFKGNELNAEISGVMNLVYSGTLKKRGSDNSIDNGSVFSEFLSMVPYPLYIGMSMTLKSRIETHRRMIESISEENYQGFIDPETVQSDSEEESRYFASRLMSVFKENKSMATKFLYLKYLVADDATRKELCQVEKYGNTIFNPIFGRR